MKTLARNVGVVALALLVAFAITAVGQTLWGVLALANVKLTPGFAWSAIVMPFVLAALVAFLAGRGWPKAGASARRALVPLGPVSGQAWLWSLVGGGLAVVAAAALWSVMAAVVRVPPNLLPNTRGLPLTTTIPMLAVAITAAPLSEEIAFRGYAMGFLRRRFSPATALVITSAIFAAAHLTQGVYAPKLIVYFLAGLAFGFVALRTGSLIPAMVVHSFGDLIFFAAVWPHDAGRRLIGEGGADAGFFTDVALLAAAAPLALLAFRQLTRITAPSKPPARAGALAAA